MIYWVGSLGGNEKVSSKLKLKLKLGEKTTVLAILHGFL
jgi:hypothetical protein